jgi:Tol biopolymer transport system component
LNLLWNNRPPLSQEQMMSLSRNGRAVVFSAVNFAENDNTPDIYFLPIRFGAAGEAATEPPAQPPANQPGTAPATSAFSVSRVTAKDSGVNSWPAISPDGRLVAFVADTTAAGGEGIDLYVVPVQGGEPRNLTADLQAGAFFAPEWSPDGKLIAFQVMPTDSQNSDIYIMNADGSEKKPLVSGEGDNTRPHWSPDGRHIAFSSNRTGKWEIFIVEVATGTIFQVTQGRETMICTSWAS